MHIALFVLYVYFVSNYDTVINFLNFYTGVCPTLQDPINGKVITLANTAYFICFSGTVVIGNPIIRCINGTWTGPPPICKLNP